ncbi:aldo/keto reductase [Streptomyces radicis]|uniref:Aldo/keto reductase n=1 Tax=Streptomyces radicis TaxID=1750517 RepID=A0A3A9W405_9ACTN|nr:aldo/keto reductase [Streptomyces radicis]RKN07580.1 aldo/keto reductase [Streptomyces radicis]RKN18303.1 aldo/keto reductase [Streptomyces radicis]
MRYRNLGTHGPRVPAIGFGAMTLAPGVYEDVTERQATSALLEAVDSGQTLIDTADIYGADGYSERLIGRVLAGRRDAVVLATKFGGNTDESGRFIAGLGRPAQVRRAIEASLTRLGTDHVDLYYLHRLDPTTPIEDTVGAMAELVAAGTIRAIGLSEVSPATLRRAHAVHPVAALQTEYSLFSRGPEDELLDVCRELGVTFVAYSPLGRGLLGGSVRSVDDLPDDDWRRGNPRFVLGNIDSNVGLADRLASLAAEAGITPAQLALAWLLDRDTLPIPGSRRAEHVRANGAAADLAAALDPEILRRLTEAIPREAVAGAQADAQYLAAIDTGA